MIQLRNEWLIELHIPGHPVSRIGTEESKASPLYKVYNVLALAAVEGAPGSARGAVEVSVSAGVHTFIGCHTQHRYLFRVEETIKIITLWFFPVLMPLAFVVREYSNPWVLLTSKNQPFVITPSIAESQMASGSKID